MSKSISCIKLILLGDSNVGKTSIVQRYMHNKFQDEQSPTIGAAFDTSKILISGIQYELNIWDTAGQEAYRSLLPMFFRSANIAMITFDVTSRSSFEAVPEWLSEVKQQAYENVIIILVANKIDLEERRMILQEEIVTMAKKCNASISETSASTGQGIEQAFESALMLYILGGQIKRDSLDNDKMINIKNEKERNRCC
ncbi:Ras-related protein Rab-19 [Tritrichomonas foetus]|uniref:Ras-related protein Rab-19 n=1 Tax=Tritrichomonas foetus TaxID=1144522 RepID=A0A1J4JQ48_9EUKA|nr:Ras-related protein Rab-19 [Tritrichomonas foetus]|eukprot:OHS99643.1 Ras-related protein Rab-19 [Tritrichomonas foetus]